MLGTFVGFIRSRDRHCSRCGTPIPEGSGQCPNCLYTDEDELLAARRRFRSPDYLKERNRGFLFLGAVALGIVLLTLIFGILFQLF